MAADYAPWRGERGGFRYHGQRPAAARYRQQESQGAAMGSDQQVECRNAPPQVYTRAIAIAAPLLAIADDEGLSVVEPSIDGWPRQQNP